MCDTCNCNREESFVVHPDRPLFHEHAQGTSHAHDHSHGEGHDHAHSHHPAPAHDHSHATVVPVHQSILSRNDRRAERNRGYFEARKVLVLNLISSPGAGKTTLLEKTLEALKDNLRVAVIVGDLATENDANRLRGKGAEIIQITTGTLCHLDAEMVHRGLRTLDLDGIDVLFIENVGNLVCPASFDLGEAGRVILLSVPEGEDKPLKYPPAFKSADAILLTKTDLASASGFDRETAVANVRNIAPQAELIELSARTGKDFTRWLDWLERKRTQGLEAHFDALGRPPDTLSSLPR